MQVIGYRGRTPVPEIGFKRPIDISSSDFDGTDTANIPDSAKTLESNGSKFNPWERGFLIQAPATDGIIYCLMFEDYKRQAYTIDDTLLQPVYVTAGQWSNDRVIKVYTADNTSDTTIYIGV
jgi:hypothetical protein